MAREVLETGGRYPERAAQNAIVGTFLADFTRLVSRWATWAAEAVEAWPDDPRDAAPDLEAIARVARRRTVGIPGG